MQPTAALRKERKTKNQRANRLSATEEIINCWWLLTRYLRPSIWWPPVWHGVWKLENGRMCRFGGVSVSKLTVKLHCANHNETKHCLDTVSPNAFYGTFHVSWNGHKGAKWLTTNWSTRNGSSWQCAAWMVTASKFANWIPFAVIILITANSRSFCYWSIANQWHTLFLRLVLAVLLYNTKMCCSEAQL